MSEYSKTRRDKAIANEFHRDDGGNPPDLMCHAHGCPNRWSVETDGRWRLCSAHAWVEPHHWPQITQEEFDFAAMRAQRRLADVLPVSREEKSAILGRLRGVVGQMSAPARDRKQWARDLRASEEAGERLTAAQRTTWRTALASEATAPQAEEQ